MKRIVLVILILVILFIVGLIILKKIDNNETSNGKVEHFQQSIGDGEYNDNEVDGSLEVEVPGGIVNLVNVSNVYNKFYEIPKLNKSDCKNNNTCNLDSDCDVNQECVDALGEGNKCYNYIDKPSYELESDKLSYISMNNVSQPNFSFKFSFVLKNASEKKFILSSESNLWSIYNQDNNIFIILFNEGNISSNKNDVIKINSTPIECYKLYNISIVVTKKKLNINFNDIPLAIEVFLKLKNCVTSNDCSNGSCVGESTKRCIIDQDVYYFGKFNNDYFDMFIGGFEINNNINNTYTNSECKFKGSDYKNKVLCESDCTNSGCSEYYCENECDEVPVCAFETTGRHQLDCIQSCIKFNDCSSEFCIDKCTNCAPNCPWNKKQSSYEEYDSQYFDLDGKPSPLKLTLNTISTDGTKVSVRWRTPHEGKDSIKGYISYLYKTFNKSEGVKINKINLTKCEKKLCEYILADLVPNETYTLGIKSYNDIGLSKTSNLLTFKASITNINMDLRIEQEVNDNDIGDFNYCNLDN